MSTTTDTTPGADMSGPAGAEPAPKDPYIRGTDETVLLDLRELRAQEAADKAAREAYAQETSAPGAPETLETLEIPENGQTPEPPGIPGAELEHYHGSHRRDAVLYADGGTAIPLDRIREVCHDLRQPVAAILMLASAAEMRPDVPERVRDVLQEIMSQTEEISATVRQFLDDAKQGVDGLGEPVPCNVAGLAAESVERWRATFDGDLALAAAEDPLHVTVDPVLFKRALGNVLSNGTRAAGDSGRVQVTVRRFETAQGERAVIEVDDSGPGFGNIPAGHGLGLAVVRRTMEAAGGSVEVAEGPLGGALVRLVLPVTPVRPLSADDELTKTFHGEISLTQLAARLAAGGAHPALADFDDDLFDDDEFEDDVFEGDVFEGEFDEGFESPADSSSLTGGHAFMTRLSAWSEPMAISGTPEQLAIGGTAGPTNPFGARAAESPAIASAPAADNRSYFGLPAQQGLPASEEKATGDRGFFGEAEHKTTDPGASGYFGLPLKDNAGPAEPPPAPHTRLYGPPADISAHPLPAGLRSAQHDAAPTPQAPSEITAAAHPVRSAAVTPQPSIETAAAPVPAAPAAPQTLAEALAESAAAGKAFAAPVPAVPAAPAAPAAPQPAATPEPAADPEALPAPTFEPGDTQPLHIIPTGQDDTALASIQLPSQANLTHPPRIPASALQPVASVQLSLLPGGAF
jgi:signal transduction histidine kinase